MRSITVSAFTFVSFLVLTGSAAADAVYSYTGNDFTSVSGPYTTAMSVSGSMTLASALAPNLVDEDISSLILGYSFFDGAQTIDSSTLNSLIFSWYVTTNGSGDLTDWYIVVGNFGWDIHVQNDAQVGTSTGLDIVDYGELAPDAGYVYDSPGTWSLVPEPSTAVLLSGGLMALASRGRRRRLA